MFCQNTGLPNINMYLVALLFDCSEIISKII